MTLQSGPFIKSARETYLEDRVRQLQEKLELAHEKLIEVERLFGTEDELMPLRVMGFTGHEATLLHLLRNREVMTKGQLMFALYADDPDRMAEADPKIVDVVMCKVRGKLKRMGVEIETVWGCGHLMKASQKARLARLVTSGAALVFGGCADQRLLHRRQRAANDLVNGRPRKLNGELRRPVSGAAE